MTFTSKGPGKKFSETNTKDKSFYITAKKRKEVIHTIALDQKEKIEFFLLLAKLLQGRTDPVPVP